MSVLSLFGLGHHANSTAHSQQSGTSTVMSNLPGNIPQYAVDACAHLSRGKACSATVNGVSHSGVCTLVTASTSACLFTPAHTSPDQPVALSSEELQNIPAAAFAACVNKTRGTACTAVVASSTQPGICLAVTATQTACARVPRPVTTPVVPQADPPSVIKNIPAYALTACDSKTPGTACEEAVNGVSKAGICLAVTATQAACAPQSSTFPNMKNVPAYALTACVNKQQGTACSVASNGNELPGFCIPVSPTTTACSLSPQ